MSRGIKFDLFDLEHLAIEVDVSNEETPFEIIKLEETLKVPREISHYQIIRHDLDKEYN